MRNPSLQAILVGLLGIAAGATSLTAQEESTQWVLRAPGDFPSLSPALQSALAARSCAIPQDTARRRPHNVIAGQFDHLGQRDVAVLCVRDSTAVIYVAWAGDPQRLDSLTPTRYLPGTTITVAGPDYIRRHLEQSESPHPDMPAHPSHDGIEEGRGCCSMIHYRYRGRWLLAPGAD